MTQWFSLDLNNIKRNIFDIVWLLIKVTERSPQTISQSNTLFASSFDFLFEIVPNWDSLMSDVVGGRKGGTSEMDGKHSVS